jgi:Lrp/AsnC family leucine-responsive transcriptional regulator
LDRIDHAILAELEADGRLGFTALGEKVGLSKTACWKRVQAMEASGVIRCYRAVLDPGALNLGLNAFVQVTLNFGEHEQFEAAATAHPAILACYTTAGEGDFLLHVVAEGVEKLDALLRYELSRLPGVQRFSTTVCLTTIKEHGALTASAATKPKR